MYLAYLFISICFNWASVQPRVFLNLHFFPLKISFLVSVSDLSKVDLKVAVATFSSQVKLVLVEWVLKFF